MDQRRAVAAVPLGRAHVADAADGRAAVVNEDDRRAEVAPEDAIARRADVEQHLDDQVGAARRGVVAPQGVGAVLVDGQIEVAVAVEVRERGPLAVAIDRVDPHVDPRELHGAARPGGLVDEQQVFVAVGQEQIEVAVVVDVAAGRRVEVQPARQAGLVGGRVAEHVRPAPDLVRAAAALARAAVGPEDVEVAVVVEVTQGHAALVAVGRREVQLVVRREAPVSVVDPDVDPQVLAGEDVHVPVPVEVDGGHVVALTGARLGQPVRAPERPREVGRPVPRVEEDEEAAPVVVRHQVEVAIAVDVDRGEPLGVERARPAAVEPARLLVLALPEGVVAVRAVVQVDLHARGGVAGEVDVAVVVEVGRQRHPLQVVLLLEPGGVGRGDVLEGPIRPLPVQPGAAPLGVDEEVEAPVVVEVGPGQPPVLVAAGVHRRRGGDVREVGARLLLRPPDARHDHHQRQNGPPIHTTLHATPPLRSSTSSR